MRLILFLFTFCIIANSYSQIRNEGFIGGWLVSYYYAKHLTDTTNCVDFEQSDKDKIDMCLLMSDGKGVFVYSKFCNDFKWFITKDTITFESNYNLPLVGKYHYSYNGNSFMILEKVDKQIEKTHVVMKKNNIRLKLLDDDSIKAVKYHQDKEFAFNNRTIKAQPPKIAVGNYDAEANILYLSKKDYTKGSIGVAKRYDQLELFVIENNKNSIASFIIIYDPNDISISGIYHIKSFNAIRYYDSMQRVTKSTYGKENIWRNLNQ